MKIVAHVNGRYLVEVTGSEIAQAMGFSNDWSSDFKEATRAITHSGGNSGGMMKIGSELDVSAQHAALRAVMAKEEDVRKASATLTALAGLLDKGLPSAFIPPEPPAEPAETGAAT